MRHPSRIGHNGDTGADVHQGPTHRFLFRLSPCINLLYCLLLLDIPWVFHKPIRDIGVIGFLHDRSMHVPGITGSRASFSPIYVIKSKYLRECSAHEFGLICISSESCLWSNVGFARLLGLLPCVPFYRLRRPKENYCNCALVISDEHLSRESRKLTVMIQRETGQPLEDSSESIGFLRINEGPVYRSSTCTVSGRSREHQGLHSSPTIKLPRLSESVTAI